MTSHQQSPPSDFSTSSHQSTTFHHQPPSTTAANPTTHSPHHLISLTITHFNKPIFHVQFHDETGSSRRQSSNASTAGNGTLSYASSSTPMKFHMMAHTALDIMQERLNQSMGGGSTSSVAVLPIDGSGVGGSGGKNSSLAMASNMSQQNPSSPSPTPAPKDLFLGLLFPSEQYKLYGYATNCHTKFILICAANEFQALRDSEYRAFLSQVHRLYVEQVANVFYEVGGVIPRGGRFERGLMGWVRMFEMKNRAI